MEIGSDLIQIARYPTSAGLSRELKRQNVWEWLSLDAKSKATCEFLIASGRPDLEEVINFFCDLYNKRAISRRKATPFPALVKLSKTVSKLTHQQRLDILANEEGSNCELMVFTVLLHTMFLGVILYPRTATASIFNWTGDGELAAKACEVSSLLRSYL